MLDELLVGKENLEKIDKDHHLIPNYTMTLKSQISRLLQASDYINQFWLILTICCPNSGHPVSVHSNSLAASFEIPLSSAS